MPLELLPRSIGIGDVIEAATQRTYADAARKALSLEHLAPAFTLLTDRTGRAVGPETMRLYAEHFAAIHISIEAVYEAIRDIVLTWEKAYWPTAEYIGNVAQRKQRAASNQPNEMRSAVRHVESMAESDLSWEDRRHRAEEWFEANPALGKLLVAGIDADIAEQVAKHPTWHIATSAAYHRLFRHGAIVGACLGQIAWGQSIFARRELWKLSGRFPAIAVDLYAEFRIPEPEEAP